LPGDRPRPIEGRLNVPLEPATLRATATVSLSNEAANEGVSVEQRDADLREWVAKVVFPAFIKANALTLIALGLLALTDQGNIAVHLITPEERIIGGQVIMALLGATTVQVGAIAFIIARYLFPGRRT